MLKPQIQKLKEAGYDVCAMCVPGVYEKALNDAGIKIVPVDIRRSMTPFQDLKSLWQLYRNFKIGKYDIVHTHTPKVSLLGQMAAWFAGVPIIINTVHGFYFHDGMSKKKYAFYVLMEKIAAKFSSRILSQNSEDIDSAVRLKICKPEKIRQLGNGINLERFKRENFPHTIKKSIRRDLGIPEDAFVAGIVGRMVREKGYLELFQAASTLVKKSYHIWLLCIGPEEPEKDDAVSRSDAEHFGIKDRAVFCGHRNDVDLLMTAMDVFVLPSYREGYPRSAMEASAMSLPVIATQIRGCREVVADGETGFLVKPQDANELADAIEKLLVNPELRTRMGQAAKLRAEKKFDEQQVVNILLDEYSSLLKKMGTK